VRYGDLLLDETQVDVMEFPTGGINEDLGFSGTEGVVFSTQARPAIVRTRVVRTSRGLAIALNLVGQDELELVRGENDPVPQPGIELRLAPVGEPLLGLEAEAAGEQSDALSVGQPTRLDDLPIMETWALTFIANSDLA